MSLQNSEDPDFCCKDTIIILTGQRRIGKSYILRLFRDKVGQNEHTNVTIPRHQDSDSITHLHLRRFLTEGLK